MAAAAIENGKRIIFQFDRAAFSFNFLPFKVPYPVPFRILGDEAKGWLDTTYLSPSGNLRISRGNKTYSNVSIVQGTTFVLQKKTEPRQRLLAAISTGTQVRETETDSWLENAANGLMGKQNGQLKFVVDILLGLRFSMTGTYESLYLVYVETCVSSVLLLTRLEIKERIDFVVKGNKGGDNGSRETKKSGTNKYDVIMDDAAIIAGPYGYPLEMETKINLELLYGDEKVRISKGYNNYAFVHVRTDGTKQK
ncbi:hypothetical protein GH714_013309 [Hevea brasiliensis]|uniref:Plastid lipid-associated protein/fibrillin conserved domain-containing protein n=1 Tax=Hevea brasiliensis TaxID=3981 RepID=A0A6A6KBJ6_HEVBR|nr:hypothetical protein GH714_013309 [Hevea brasiliensis]